ncbi:MAG: pentapeptide repeat-containing protein, partial [Dehalococcoidales bacterium]
KAGMTDKTIWDWLSVLGVPVIVVVLAGLFAISAQRAGQRTRLERDEEIRRVYEAALRTYFDRMTNLTTEHGLLGSKMGDPVRALAQAEIRTALRTLDRTRKGVPIGFLKEAGLIRRGSSVVSLALADLREANLSSADLADSDLCEARLSGADLYYANLRGADLRGADLQDADLDGADLRGADLRNADFRGAGLRGAHVDNVQLAQVANLVGSWLPDGSQVTEEIWNQLRASTE